MKIIKKFTDCNFFERHFHPYLNDEELKKGFWNWGLGNDGNLYFQTNAPGWELYPSKNWYSYPDSGYDDKLLVTFDEMRKIVKEFGHLIIFT